MTKSVNDLFMDTVRAAKISYSYKTTLEEMSIVYCRENSLIGRQAVTEMINSWARPGLTMEQRVEIFCSRIEGIYPEHAEQLRAILKN